MLVCLYDMISRMNKPHVIPINISFPHRVIERSGENSLLRPEFTTIIPGYQGNDITLILYIDIMLENE